MAKVTMEIKARVPSPSQYEAFGAWMGSVAPSTLDRFFDEWETLKQHGAEPVDVGFCYGIVHCWISDDFRQHCRKFGFEWPET